MAKIVCPKCGTKNKDTRETCKSCGHALHGSPQLPLPIEPQTGRKKDIIAYLASLIAPQDLEAAADTETEEFGANLCQVVMEATQTELEELYKIVTASEQVSGFSDESLLIRECVTHTKLAMGCETDDNLTPNDEFKKLWAKAIKKASQKAEAIEAAAAPVPETPVITEPKYSIVLKPKKCAVEIARMMLDAVPVGIKEAPSLNDIQQTAKAATATTLTAMHHALTGITDDEWDDNRLRAECSLHLTAIANMEIADENWLKAFKKADKKSKKDSTKPKANGEDTDLIPVTEVRNDARRVYQDSTILKAHQAVTRRGVRQNVQTTIGPKGLAFGNIRKAMLDRNLNPPSNITQMVKSMVEAGQLIVNPVLPT